MMTVNMHDMGNKSLLEMTHAIADTVRRANNSDMNEVMFEVSLDNTLNGLAEGKILQTVCRLFGSKMPGKHMVHTLSGKEKENIIKFPLRTDLQNMISSRALPPFQISVLFTEVRKASALCLRLYRRRQLLLQ